MYEIVVKKDGKEVSRYPCGSVHVFEEWGIEWKLAGSVADPVGNNGYARGFLVYSTGDYCAPEGVDDDESSIHNRLAVLVEEEKNRTLRK